MSLSTTCWTCCRDLFPFRHKSLSEVQHWSWVWLMCCFSTGPVLAAPRQPGLHRFAFPVARVKPSRARLADVMEKRTGMRSGLTKTRKPFFLYGALRSFVLRDSIMWKQDTARPKLLESPLLFEILKNVVAFWFLFIWKPAADKTYHHSNATGDEDDFE